MASKAGVIEDKTICVGENWTNGGVKDADTEAAEMAGGALNSQLGLDWTVASNIVQNFRRILDAIYNDL